MRPLDPRLLRYAKATKGHLVTCAVLGVATGLLAVGQAWVVASAIARAIERGGPEGLGPLLVVLGLLFAARALVAWIQEIAAQRASAAVKSDLRHQLVARVVAPGPDPLGGVRRAEVSELAMGGLDALDDYFGRYLPQLVLALVVPVIVLVALGRTDSTAMLTVLFTLPLIPLFLALVGAATESANRRRWRALERLSHHFLDVIEGMPTLRAFGRGRAQVDNVRLTTDQYRTTTMATLRIAFLSSLVLELLATLSVALVAVGVGLRLVDGDLDLRTGLFLIVLAPEAYLPLRQVGVHYHASAAGLAAAESAFAVLQAPIVPAGRLDVPDLSGGLELVVEGLTVRHDGRDRAAPDGLDVVARSGEVVAVVGPSGSGKSTLLAVLLGFRRGDEGIVTVVGDRSTDLSDIEPSAWRAQVAWVDQFPFVRLGTVAENLRLADPLADDDTLRDALDRVGLAFPLDRVLGERGVDLSAGERRRLAMARALVRRAPLVVLDEPTAGLDHETEEALLRAVRSEAERGAAVVMVAHRPAAVATVDRVVRL